VEKSSCVNRPVYIVKDVNINITMLPLGYVSSHRGNRILNYSDGFQCFGPETRVPIGSLTSFFRKELWSL
jgi:hypothetical protein